MEFKMGECRLKANFQDSLATSRERIQVEVVHEKRINSLILAYRFSNEYFTIINSCKISKYLNKPFPNNNPKPRKQNADNN